MKKIIQLILEVDTEDNVPFETFKKDLEAEISCASWTYKIKECMEESEE